MGCALLVASSGKSLVVHFVLGELLVYVAYKLVRRDFLCWMRLDGILSVTVSIVYRLLVKIIVDYSGCLHLRLPNELGGFAFSVSMLWAQIFPFVALQLYTSENENVNEMKENLNIFLICIFALWLLLNIAFFAMINLKFIGTFVSTQTAGQYACEWFLTADEDQGRFGAAFYNRISFKKPIDREVKEWVAENIEMWKLEKPVWFYIEKIPDDFLPDDVFEAEGGANRRRSIISVRELVGFDPLESVSAAALNETAALSSKQEEWKTFAEEIYMTRSGNYKSNYTHLKRVFEINAELLAPLLTRCPNFKTILSYILADRFGLRVQAVGMETNIKDWGVEECRRCGSSLATFIRNRQTGPAAIEAWRHHYKQLDILFDEVDGFNDFVLVLAYNTTRDSIYGTVYRVSVGALLSFLDVVTDLYVLSTYYSSDELIFEANALLGMILTGIFIQICFVFVQYQSKSLKIRLVEALVTLICLRSIVDAFRVSKNHKDDEVVLDCLSELLVNRGIELATESIPGVVLQLYVWLTNPSDAGSYAIASILISAMTTGYNSALISFDMDIDIPHRRVQPTFFGYIPDDSGLRGRCFILIMLMGAVQNVNRSVGCVLLLTSKTRLLAIFLIGGEISLYLLYKIMRGDYFWHFRIVGKLSFFVSFLQRVCVKIICDFTGNLHFRHPGELGGLAFSVGMIWAQIFPFFAFFLHDDGGKIEKELIFAFLVSSFGFWVLLTIAFFCSINLEYVGTFFDSKTFSQYTCELFLNSQEDPIKFRAVFKSRQEFTRCISREVREWVAENIDRWKEEGEEWFKISMIPDEFLPAQVFEAEGGTNRINTIESMSDILKTGILAKTGMLSNENKESKIHPQQQLLSD